MISLMRDTARQNGVFKRVRRIAGYLVLAFVLTVLSAWVPAWWSTTGTVAAIVGADHSDPKDPARTWRGRVPADWDELPLSTTTFGIARQTATGIRIVGTRLRYVQGYYGTTFETTGEGRLLDRYEIGWPWKVMTAVGPLDNRPGPTSGAAQWYARGIGLPAFEPLGMKPDRTLPLRPIWSAFTLMFFAWLVVLLLGVKAIKAPGRVRRRRRVRLGRCLACGYDITGSDRCPECGAER